MDLLKEEIKKQLNKLEEYSQTLLEKARVLEWERDSIYKKKEFLKNLLDNSNHFEFTKELFDKIVKEKFYAE
jgi:predicted  nucleic acid-binding Zn-ribbon protein